MERIKTSAPVHCINVHNYRWRNDFNFQYAEINISNPDEILWTFREKITKCSVTISSHRNAKFVDTDQLVELRKVGTLLKYLDEKNIAHGTYIGEHIVCRKALYNLMSHNKEWKPEPSITDDFVPLFYASTFIRTHIGDIYAEPF